MTCPKCNKKVNRDWLCCPFHTELVMLKEKCPECGEMEWIERKVCETKVKKIESEISSYAGENVPDYLGLGIKIAASMIVPLSIGLIADKYFSNPMIVAWIVVTSVLIFAVSMPIGGLLEFTLGKWQKERVKQKFICEHPKYAGILKKAKGEEK